MMMLRIVVVVVLVVAGTASVAVDLFRDVFLSDERHQRIETNKDPMKDQVVLSFLDGRQRSRRWLLQLLLWLQIRIDEIDHFLARMEIFLLIRSRCRCCYLAVVSPVLILLL